jgi:hypothetical protein
LLRAVVLFSAVVCSDRHELVWETTRDCVVCFEGVDSCTLREGVCEGAVVPEVEFKVNFFRIM